MKVLLDESVPEQVRNAFKELSVATVREMGWSGYRNGRLLAEVAAAGFDVFIIADKNLRFQRNLTRIPFAIFELWTNNCPALEQHFTFIEQAVNSLKPGQYAVLPEPGKI